jgi:hypothetical protein
MAERRPMPAAARIATALVLLLAGVAAASAGEVEARPVLSVPPHEAVYHATVRRIPVRATQRLEAQDGGLYVYRSWLEPRGVLSLFRRDMSENSLVRIGPDGDVLPISYRKRDDYSERHSDMHFDAAKGEVRVTFRGQETVSEWEPGIYDFLSLRLALAHDLARGALQDVYRIIDDRSRIEEVDVEVGGREILDTPVGRLETVRLEYTNRRRDHHYRLWIAVDMDAALVRLEQREGGSLRGRLALVEYRRL